MSSTSANLDDLGAATSPAGLLRDLASGSLLGIDLKERPGNCRVVRVVSGEGSSFVVKMWNRPGLRGLLRRLTGTAPHQREASCLKKLLAHGVNVPAPLGITRITHSAFAYTDALVLEDLGECEVALDRIKQLVSERRFDDVDVLLEGVVDLTVGMVEAGVIDRDHSFLNVVAQPDGRPARLDLEIAKSAVSASAYGEMLGRLVATLIFALQPDTDRVAPFVQALIQRLQPSDEVIDTARTTVEKMLDFQRDEGGPDTRIDLPWR